MNLNLTDALNMIETLEENPLAFLSGSGRYVALNENEGWALRVEEADLVSAGAMLLDPVERPRNKRVR